MWYPPLFHQTIDDIALETDSIGNSCFAHVFQLAINDALNDEENSDISTTITKIKEIVAFVRKSENFLSYMKKQTFNKPKKDTPTRWDSCYLMLETIINNIHEINSGIEHFKNCELSKNYQNVYHKKTFKLLAYC